MGKIANNIYAFLSRYKYIIVAVIGITIVVFLDDNSFIRSVEYKFEISDLKSEIEKYNKQYESDVKKLRDLDRDPHLIERIAREKYFMKCDDEDIFVLSDDQTPENETKNETSE